MINEECMKLSSFEFQFVVLILLNGVFVSYGIVLRCQKLLECHQNRGRVASAPNAGSVLSRLGIVAVLTPQTIAKE